MNIIKKLLDEDHDEVLFPMLVPESELAKEGIHGADQAEVHEKLCDRDIVRYCDFSLHFENVTFVQEGYSVPRNNNEMVRSLLHGIDNENLLDELDGKIALVEGNRFTKEEIQNGERVVLVSNEVKYNGEDIKVGDSVTYYGRVGSFRDKVITHQVIKIEHDVDGKRIFHTKGISNLVEDPLVYEDQIYGVVVHRSEVLSFITCNA